MTRRMIYREIREVMKKRKIQRIVRYVYENPGCNTSSVAKEINADYKSGERYLKKLSDLGIVIRRQGANRNIRYAYEMNGFWINHLGELLGYYQRE